MKIKETKTELSFKPFKIEIEIKNAEDLLWLYGISYNSQSMTRQHLEEMAVTHKLSRYSSESKMNFYEAQMNFYEAMEDLYERKILQSSWSCAIIRSSAGLTYSENITAAVKVGHICSIASTCVCLT